MTVSVVVTLPTHTAPSYGQRIHGRPSSITGVEEFRGIPYGIVPARWQHAQLRDRLPQDTFDATRNGPRCPQPQEPNNSDFFQSHLDFPTDVEESEFECLNLFITRPSPDILNAAGFDSDNSGLPVYVYIHGGAYGFGAGTDPMWDPARLVKKSVSLGTPIIVATVNYRLNMFGFAASTEIIETQPEDKKGCNLGLGDQRVALQWVQQNIAAFGGDPRRVTVGGQSAGGSSSHAHVLEAVLGKSQPLCQQGIIQSGAVGVLGPIPMEAADARWATFCKALGAPTGDSEARMAFMRTVPVADILRANAILGWFVFPLVIDDLTISQRPNGRWNVHLDHNDLEKLSDHSASHDQQPIAVLVGDTDLEGTLHQFSVSQLESFEEIHRKSAAEVSEAFRKEFYTAYHLRPGISKENLQNQVYRFLSDIQFGYPVQRCREELMSWEVATSSTLDDALTPRPTKVESFRMAVGNPFPGINHGKAHHCVDLIYIYDCFAEALRESDRMLPEGTVPNASLVDRVQTDWINFITGSQSANYQPGLATVYHPDRTATKVEMALDEDWVDRMSRLSLIDRYPRETKHIANILSGGGHLF
ncbi:carboxylesterase [Aspergillus saccharolyticus JOP 1030-1]|uniref:Carboxylic ester hydrolase n=1 Tax=Aspergillus saccharolyticus JOP 1030-1 TaxID=1450539 RepID=A0A319A4A9_9EURO|nr:carboxylesterase [Aspergillus saccharolyticus JOP 1030-1]PYH42272.1 carboxylesterase [Aspergillus saccharolyticus JOP 1030-1]